MKKLIIILLLFFVVRAQATDYYFSSLGSNSNSGTIGSPFQTLSKLSLITLSPGDHIYLNRGNTFAGGLTISQNGSILNPITFDAYGSGAKPVITGFSSATGFVRNGITNIWESAALTTTITKPNIVMINGAVGPIARYPNSTFLKFEGSGTDATLGEYVQDNDTTAFSSSWVGAEIVFKPIRHIIDRGTITSVGGNKVYYSGGSSYGLTVGNGYFFQGSYACLDQTNEWYFNPSTKKISVYSGAFAPVNVKVSTLDYLIKCNTKTYISFSNISFEGANTYNIDVTGSTGITFTGCDISYAGQDGIYGLDCRKITAIGNTFDWNLDDAMYLLLASDIAHENTNTSHNISYNTISNTGTIAGMGRSGDSKYDALAIFGAKNRIQYNTITNTGFCGIVFYWGDSTLVTNNIVNNFALTKTDAGAIYTWNNAANRLGGADTAIAYYGQKINSNIISNGVGVIAGTTDGTSIAVGIYFDHRVANVIVDSNTVSGCTRGFFSLSGYANTLRWNTFADNRDRQIDLNYDLATDHGYTMRPIRNMVVKNNKFFSKSATQVISLYRTIVNDIASFGTFDSNYYSRPILEPNGINSTTSTAGGGIETIINQFAGPTTKYYSLDVWKTIYGLDANSNKTSSPVTDVANITLETNPTNTSQSVVLTPDTYEDLAGTSYSGTISLAAYRSLILLNTVSTGRTFYFSESLGNDLYTSSQAQSSSTPWKTTTKLNSFMSSALATDQFLFKRGEKFYGTITVTKAGITIGAYGSGAKPVITGLTQITGFTTLGSGKYSATNSALTSSVLPTSLNIVVINDSLQDVSRYPNLSASNKGYLSISSFVGNTSLTGPSLPFNPTGAVLVSRKDRWVIDADLINSYSAGTIGYNATTTRTQKAAGYGYFIQNAVGAIDLYGEWAYAPSTKKITLYVGDDDVNADVIEAASKDTGINIKANSVTIQDLTIKGFNKFGVGLNGNSDVTIDNCDIRFSGIEGIHSLSTVTNLLVSSNTIYQSLSQGIKIKGCSNLLITSNVVNKSGHRAGQGQNDSDPYKGINVNTGGGTNNIIEKNIVLNSGYVGICMAGNNLTVRKNYIDSATYVKDDAAGIYIVPSYDPTTGNYENSNRHILYNIISNMPGAIEGTTGPTPKGGNIYSDDNANHIDIRYNFCMNAYWGYYNHTGHNIMISNNTFLNNVKAMYWQGDNSARPLSNDSMYNNLFITETNNISTQEAFEISQTSLANAISLNKIIDSNYYVTPVNSGKVIKMYATGAPAVNATYTFSEWKTLYAPYDTHGKISPKNWLSSVNVSDSILILTNPTDADQLFALPNTYVDSRGVAYSTSTTLTPWTAKVLLAATTGTFIPANILPSIGITSPTSGTSYVTVASVPFTVLATDADGSISLVRYYNGATLIGTASTAPFDFTWTPVGTGDYTITAVATDNVGANTTSSPIVVSVEPSGGIYKIHLYLRKLKFP